MTNTLLNITLLTVMGITGLIITVNANSKIDRCYEEYNTIKSYLSRIEKSHYLLPKEP